VDVEARPAAGQVGGPVVLNFTLRSSSDRTINACLTQNWGITVIDATQHSWMSTTWGDPSRCVSWFTLPAAQTLEITHEFILARLEPRPAHFIAWLEVADPGICHPTYGCQAQDVNSHLLSFVSAAGRKRGIMVQSRAPDFVTMALGAGVRRALGSRRRGEI
jgi:hypothetical protein